MATTTTATPVRADQVVIATQHLQISDLESKVKALEYIGKSYEDQKKQLDEAIKARSALQEIFFNTCMEKKELESLTEHLQNLVYDKDFILNAYKRENNLDLESLQKLHDLQLRSLRSKHTKSESQHECTRKSLQTQHAMQYGLLQMKCSTMSAKYKFISSQNKVLLKQLHSLREQLSVSETENAYLSKYEWIILNLLKHIQQLKVSQKHSQSKLRKQQQVLQQLNEENLDIRAMYTKLRGVVSEQDEKISKSLAQNNRLNTIIEQYDIQNEKMQTNFQVDIANKAKMIAKLETKLEALTKDTDSHQNMSDALKEQHKMLKEQISALKNDKSLLRKEIDHLAEKAANKDVYIETLKKQIQDLNENVNKLHDENASMHAINKNMESRLKSTVHESDHEFKQLKEKYRALQVKASKLADKLKEVHESKRALKKQYVETKQKLSESQKEHERMEQETDKQCDAVQASLQQYKDKIVKRNQQIVELENALQDVQNELIVKNQQIAVLQKENENHKFLIETLEIGQSQYHKKQRRTQQAMQRVMQENHYSTQLNNEILREIEQDDVEEEDVDVEQQVLRDELQAAGQEQVEREEEEEEDENEDDDLNANDRNKGRKRRRSGEGEGEDEDEDDEEKEEKEEPPRKKMRYNAEVAKKTDATPFKGGKSLYQPRKRRNQSAKNMNLPKPRLK
eukprot:CAMPEP_0197031824 /NCGR_PEP_ID=MMETSP1384-20130603/10691_1 /TAXON_ID=29189 /ORGANISM="Ammonia sp." /LENGTH=683 /DNA_ID=CAMNT_0042461399 /DNA_START=33 /DNA_END=2084 /DNA_ORIENTATION=-